ncbi:MAG: phosphoadenylyl-sulfate reductase [Anaerolineae bacterium]|jgi:phosphoadenosine phosphosulfate reductase|nr:phosphoadenylyl-sulfate reductase [Anaerolineae bacterium]MBT7069871.1 phosphoadenylyl-sulfate reductase [Anaerolineae bacterium]MBT7325047.1 phosphoadenylyl-sulfate reductase [Anaerolineae bacterium]
MKFSPKEIETLSNEFESATPQEIVAWAVENFCPNLALSSSFQTQAVPLLHMVKERKPEMRIFFLDTGMHFWDTLFFREHLDQIWDLNIVDLRPDEKWRTLLRHFGSDLPDTDPNLCCYIRKVQPMQKAMAGLDAWITGIRRDQTENRAHAEILEYKRDGLLRIAPLLNWTGEDISNYISQNNLPRHPMPNTRYPSLGCKPCTRAIQLGENERAGRWTGKGKTECGLHTEMFDKKEFTENGFKLNLGEN